MEQLDLRSVYVIEDNKIDEYYGLKWEDESVNYIMPDAVIEDEKFVTKLLFLPISWKDFNGSDKEHIGYRYTITAGRYATFFPFGPNRPLAIDSVKLEFHVNRFQYLIDDGHDIVIVDEFDDIRPPWIVTAQGDPNQLPIEIREELKEAILDTNEFYLDKQI